MRRFLYLLLATTTVMVANLASAKAYKGAEIYSNESYLYGRYEIRMKAAKGSAVLSTFFTYKNGSEVGNTFWEEIDIEVFGKNNATEWQSNIILGSSRPTIQTEQTHAAGVSLADDYHTYVVEWTPDYVAWFLDGVEVRRIIGTSTVTSLTNAQSLRFNLWASDSVEWVGTWDDSILPVYQFINYIDYKAYNPVTKAFEGGWRDDFDQFDTNRWGKANWSF
ncbi:MAG TPA: family 16 glycosylhydrolase, partial [Cellvibrio sp.]